MKCVMLNGNSDQIFRVSDVEAEILTDKDKNRKDNWQYCSKQLWKTCVRDSEIVSIFNETHDLLNART